MVEQLPRGSVAEGIAPRPTRCKGAVLAPTRVFALVILRSIAEIYSLLYIFTVIKSEAAPSGCQS